MLRVRDTGIGIAAGHAAAHLRAVRAGRTARCDRSQGGLGIGLTLVKQLVEMHGGSVEARSDGPGQGQRVRRAPAAVVGRAPSRSGAGRRRRARPRRRTCRLPHPGRGRQRGRRRQPGACCCGCRATRSGSPTTAWRRWRSATTYPPDVVFLDIGLPGMDGYEVARRLRQQPGLEKACCWSALTGWGQEEDRRRSRRPASTTTSSSRSTRRAGETAGAGPAAGVSEGAFPFSPAGASCPPNPHPRSLSTPWRGRALRRKVAGI